MSHKRQPVGLIKWMVLSVLSVMVHAAKTDIISWPTSVMQQAALPDMSVTTIQSDVVFNPHSAQFKSQASAYLKQILVMIKKADPKLQVYVSVYGDDIPNAIEQKRMTSAQSEAVANYLWSQGVPYERMIVRGMGCKNMLGQTHSSMSNAINRRIEVVLVPSEAPGQIYPFKE